MKKSQNALSVAFLYDDTLDSTDGVANQVKTIGAWMSSQGHTVTYLVGETKIDSWASGKVYSLAKNRRVTFNGNRLSMPMPAPRGAIKQLLKENYFDVVHVQLPYSPFMAKRVINLLNGRTAVVGTFHIYPSSKVVETGSKFLKSLLGGSLNRFDYITAVSQPAADFAKKTFGINPAVLPNVINVDRFETKNITPVDGRIVFLGRLVERKGCMYLLKAFAKLSKSIDGVELIIAGDGPQRGELEGFVTQNKLSEKVRFLGFVAEDDKAEFLAAADIACFPSIGGESFGIVLIEAMAAGTRVVLGGDNPGYRSVLGLKEQLLVDPRGTNEFASRLELLLRNNHEAAEIHKWQQLEVKKYDIDAIGPKLLDIYQELVAQKSPRRHN